jgi:protein TonB
VAHDVGMERGTPAAAFVTPQGRVLSLDTPRHTQLPCWLAATALHCAAIAIIAFYHTMPATVPAPVAIEIVILDSPHDASPPAVADPPDPAAEAEPSPPGSSTPPTPPEASMIEPPLPEPVLEHRPEPPVAVAEAPPLPAPPPPPSPRPRSISPPLLPPKPSPLPAASGFDAPEATAPRLAGDSPAAVETVAPPAPAQHRAESDYVRTLLGWLERYKEYPRAARMRRIEGQVVLELSIMADGQIAAVKVLTSSGNPTLDDAALQMVRRAAPVPRPQGGPIHLAVPVVFSLGAR